MAGLDWQESCYCLHNAHLHLLFLAKAVKPLHIRLMSEPGQLPLCIVSDVKFGLLDCAFEIAPALEKLDYAAVAVRAERV